MVHAFLTPTIFHEDWWLDAATNSGYEVVEVLHGGRIVGRLPYYRRRQYGVMWGAMPTLTHFLGPAVDEGEGGAGARLSHRLEITCELLQKLPSSHFTKVKCHRSIPDVIAFQKMKFRTSVQFTHEIHPQPEDILLKNMHRTTRQNVRYIDDRNRFVTDVDPAEFLSFYDINLDIRGKRNHLDLDVCRKLLTASLDRGVGKFYAFRQSSGELKAAIFCIWDQTSTYYLMSSRSPTSGRADISILTWKAIQEATSRNLIFDFDGLGSSGSIQLYSGFGGSVEPRYVATRMSVLATLTHDLVRRILDKEQYFY